MQKVKINTENAPTAIGPYSQGIKFGDLLFLSGQIPINPQSSQIAGDSIKTQAVQVLENIKAVLKSQGLSMSDVIKTTVFIKDLADFAEVNAIYAEYFSEPYPARSCVEVSRLPKDVLIEIEVIAAAKQ